MKKALIIGGANGIGLSVALELAARGYAVTVADKSKIAVHLIPENISYKYVDLVSGEYGWLNEFGDIDLLFYSAGIGRVAPFNLLHPVEVENEFKINALACFRILNHYSRRLYSSDDIQCGVMVSIAGRIASPLFSVYSATKAALFRGIEAINTELSKQGFANRILEVSPGSIKGTSFNGGASDPSQTRTLAKSIVNGMENHETLLIPEFDNVFSGVMARYADNPRKFADESYDYKIFNDRLQSKSPIKVGYLSGTFDLFHIGHLNLLRRAKEQCDYLVVGVHKDASHKGKTTFIPFEERKAIVGSVKYVDKVIESEREDLDVYTKGRVKYDKLFVGSDYKGTERFNRYEEYFADKDVEIVYFPYTQGTSSTQLREAINK